MVVILDGTVAILLITVVLNYDLGITPVLVVEIKYLRLGI